MLKISGEALQGHKGFGVEPKVPSQPILSCLPTFSASNVFCCHTDQQWKGSCHCSILGRASSAADESVTTVRHGLLC